MEIAILWFILTIVVGIIGTKRKIGYLPAVLLSLFLSPLIGGIITFLSPTLSGVQYKEALLNEQKKTNELLRGGHDIAGRLERLESLRDRKVISDEEFEKLKAKELEKQI